MRIAFNPSTVAALTAPPNNKDITFDLRGRNIFARGVKFLGTDTWRPVVDNLTSGSTTSSLSANLGRILAELINGKSDSGHNHDDRYLKLTGGTMTGAINLSNANAKLAFGCLATSPITGYKAPALSQYGVGIYSRYGNGADEGALIITEDTCVIYNSSDTGWNFQVMDKDLGTDLSNNATRSFGINGDHLAWSLAGFVKSGSSDSYVLLGGGGHKALSDFVSFYGDINAADDYSPTGLKIIGVYGGSNTMGSGWGSILQMCNNAARGYKPNVDNGRANWYTQIMGNTDDKIRYRTSTNGSGWTSWKTLLSTADLQNINVASATKLQTSRSIWGQSFNGTADVNGTIYINNSDSDNGAIRLNNNINSNARISAILDQVIFNTSNAIRFGETAWDWNEWAGLKYTHSNKTIYLGIADGSIFNSNSTLGGGTLNLRAGISSIDLNSGTAIRGCGTNGSPHNGSITLNDTSIYLSAYEDISMSTGPSAIKLTSGYGGVKLSCLSTNVSINPGGFQVEASQGVYLNPGNSGNVYLCLGGGNVSIGYSSPSYKLDVNGLMRADGFHHWFVNSNDYVLLAGGGYLIHKTGSTTWSTAILFGNYVWIILLMDNATNGRQVVPNNIAKPTKDIYVLDIQTGDYNNARNGIYRIAPDGNLYHVNGPDGKRLYTTICYVAS